MTHKICQTCKKSLVLKAFSHLYNTPDGYQHTCKECMVRQMKEKREAQEHDHEALRESNPALYKVLLQRWLYGLALKRSRKNKLSFTIKPEDIEIPETCPVFGWKLARSGGSFKKNSYSLDRLDSEKGYVPGNVRVISWYANNLKGNMTVDEVKNLLKYMEQQ